VKSSPAFLVGIWVLAQAGAVAALPALSDQPAEGAAAKTAAKPAAIEPKPAAAPLPPLSVDSALLAPSAPPPRGETQYVGVVPGAETRNPLPPAGKAPPHLIWSGFQSGENGSKVFFQTNLPVTFELGKAAAGQGGKPGTVSVFLRNCRIHLRNNSRHLDTRFFPTPVEGVTAVQRRKDVELRISLKQAATVAPRTEPGPDGTQFLVLEFPPGQPVAESASREPAADPAR
jgi:hypothetical protein